MIEADGGEIKFKGEMSYRKVTENVKMSLLWLLTHIETAGTTSHCRLCQEMYFHGSLCF